MSEILGVEWLCGLYTDPSDVVAIPADNILAMTVEGARKSKLGKDAAAGIYEVQPFYKLDYKGPQSIEALYSAGGFIDYRSVCFNQRRIMRARPRFPEWRLPIELMVETEIMEVSAARDALRVSGERIGLCDYRPRFGRFHLEDE